MLMGIGKGLGWVNQVVNFAGWSAGTTKGLAYCVFHSCAYMTERCSTDTAFAHFNACIFCATWRAQTDRRRPLTSCWCFSVGPLNMSFVLTIACWGVGLFCKFARSAVTVCFIGLSQNRGFDLRMEQIENDCNNGRVCLRRGGC